MHHDGSIKDQTTGIKEDRGPLDVGSCPLFASDVHTSESSDLHRTGERRRDRGIVAHNRGRQLVFTESDGPRFSRTFSYKNRCILFF